jgi:hypothetical protein
MVEDVFNVRWKELVSYVLHTTFDENRFAGWYNSSITIVPEPKPIRTGATLCSMCVTFGPLETFKLHVRTYGVREDKDMTKSNPNVEGSGVQKNHQPTQNLHYQIHGAWSLHHHGFHIHWQQAGLLLKLVERCGC